MNIQGNQDNFSFFAPLAIMSKGKKGDKDSQVMKMMGVASTSTQDADGEFLDPNGFDLKYFLNHGYMNWNHQSNKNPLAIIGRPIKASIKKGNMMLECELFKDNPLAKDVYKLAEVLESQGLGLGYSIEGKVVKRDKDDPRKVLKAVITGCAITPNPKNQDSVANIIKGFGDDDFNIIKGMYSAYEESTEEEREKAMMAGSESGMAISKESLDSEEKDLTKKKLSKAEVIDQLMKSHPNNTAQQIKSIYNIVETIEKREQMKKEDVTISQESIEEAYSVLGLDIQKGETNEEEASTEETTSEEVIEENEEATEETQEEAATEETTEESTEEAATEEAEEESTEDNIEKGENTEDDKEDYVMKGGKKYIMKDGGYESEGKKYKFEKGEMIEEKEDKVEKGFGNENTMSSDLMKGFTDLMKSQFEEQSSKMDAKFKALGKINKGLEDQIGEFRQRLEDIENTPNQQKSITNIGYVEKSYDNDNNMGAEGNRQMSVSLHKAEVLNILDAEAGISKGEIINEQLAKDVCAYETTSAVTPLMQKVMLEKGIVLTK